MILAALAYNLLFRPPGMITQLRRVLQDGEDYINSEYDVDKLCGGEFLERMAELKDREGDRLKH